MSNRYFRENGDAMIVDGNGGNGGGFGDLGGIGAIIALVVVVAILWFLAREGKGNDGCYNGGYGNMPYPIYPPYAPAYGGGCCNSPLDCKIPMAPDMSNCEVDKDLWKVDADIWKANCKTIDVVKDGDQAILNKMCETETQNLRDKLAKEYAKNSACETREYTSGLFNKLENMIYKMDNQNDKQISYIAGSIKDLKCEIDHCFPKLPPQWIDSISPNTHHSDCHDFPKRCGCNDNFNNCGCN